MQRLGHIFWEHLMDWVWLFPNLFCATCVRKKSTQQWTKMALKEREMGRERARDTSCICDTAQKSPCPCMPPTACAHTHCCSQCMLAEQQHRQGIKKQKQKKHTLRRLEGPRRCRIPQRVGFSKEDSYYDAQLGAGRATEVPLKQGLCSWDRHGYHGNKNKKKKNSQRQRARLTTSLFTFFSTVWEPLCVLVKQWFPQLWRGGICTTTLIAAPKTEKGGLELP